MTLTDFLPRLQAVKVSGDQYYARCPAHDDHKQSLSVRQGDKGGIVVRCHAGCSTEAVISTLDLSMKDLAPEGALQSKSKTHTPVVATYDYRDANGALLAQKLRRADKSFTWRRPNGNGGWEYNRKGVPALLYRLPEVLREDSYIFVVEGEKDADTLVGLGWTATTGADGAGGKSKWKPEYTEQLRGKHCLVIGDHDAPGKSFAEETAAALHGVAASVKLLDLCSVWPEIPEHGDVTDFIHAKGVDEGLSLLADLMAGAQEWKPGDEKQESDRLLSCFKTLDKFSEEDATWIVPGWLPEGQITLMAADGGIGKTSVWCNLVTAFSNGTSCILDPSGHTRQAMKVAFLTTEDSVRKKLKKKLREAGANEKNILTPDFLADKDGVLRDLKFGSSQMERVIRHFRPALCVFDPVQGFIPPLINMGSRNAMRDCMAPLIALGEECGTTFLIVCHTNKRKGASGRDRIADSADLWDVSRSVIMAGYTEDQGIRYLSNEKNNYAPLQETLLFSIGDGGQVKTEGTTWKRDREYIQDSDSARAAPKREECKEFILHTLTEAGGTMPTKELEEKAKTAGHSFSSIKRAKQELKDEGKVCYFQTGGSKEKVWYIQKLDFVDLPSDTPIPWTE